jgi:hypothetical protein
VEKVGIGKETNMTRLLALCAVLSVLTGCRSAATTSLSAWSEPVDGLQFHISSHPHFGRNTRGAAMLEVTCKVTNSGPEPRDVVHLARPYLIDAAGVTNRCLRTRIRATWSLEARRWPPAKAYRGSRTDRQELVTGAMVYLQYGTVTVV